MGYQKPRDAQQMSERARDIRRMLLVGLLLNLSVALAKLTWGIVSGSTAMQADGFHSLFDGASNVIGLLGITIAARPADRSHPYGHSKFETYASMAIAVMLALAAYRIGAGALQQLVGGGEPPAVGGISFAIMLGTLVVNAGTSLWERRAGKRLSSEVLTADASHTASDVFVSLGVIASLVLVRVGEATGQTALLKADPIVALIVAGVIAYTAWGVFKQANATLSDSARIDPQLICERVLGHPGVLGCHEVRTRGAAAEVYVDLHIQVDGAQSVNEGHRVAEGVERMLVESFDEVVDAIVHLEPYDAYQIEKTVDESDAGIALAPASADTVRATNSDTVGTRESDAAGQ